MINVQKYEEDFIHIIQIEELNEKWKGFIKEDFSSICLNWDKEEIESVLKRFWQSYEKKDDNTKKGMIAEFFAHLYLRNELKFEQKSLFSNLEENSIKKGFDGVYQDTENKIWIMESKSGNLKKISLGSEHVNNLNDGYIGISKKISGKDVNNNNPWLNALHHSKIIDGSEELQKILKKRSKELIHGDGMNISEINIIPTSTVYFENEIEKEDLNMIEKIKNKKEKMKCMNLIIVCVNKRKKEIHVVFINI